MYLNEVILNQVCVGLKNAKRSDYLFKTVGRIEKSKATFAAGCPPSWKINWSPAGQVAEQFVAQHLQWWLGAGSTPALHYWARSGETANAEVDFIVQLGTNIFPVEVKSGVAGSLRSMHQFLVKGHAPFGVRLDMDVPGLHPIDHEVRVGKDKHQRLKSRLLSLPLYMIGQLRRLMEDQLRA